MRSDSHPSDQELLLAADGELSPRRARQMEEHLLDCQTCRSRKRELEAAIGDFARQHTASLTSQIPAAAEQRALLRARLEEAAEAGWNRGALLLTMGRAAAALAFVALVFVAYRSLGRTDRTTARVVAVPDRILTPGLAVRVNRDQLCAASPAKNRMVPVSLRRQVLREYGIQRDEPQTYEVDYLITPALGGADDIRNLWPQSYSATVWNAKVKDALEDRLHDLVCEGQLDLETAQRDIASDWVGAYKKYFHTDKPLSVQ